MSRTTINELKDRRLAATTADERAEFDVAHEATSLAIEVGEQIRDARKDVGLSQRQLASRIGTSQAAIARLEAGSVAPTLTTLEKVAAALNVKIAVGLSKASQ